jgi:hypothetical protein
VRSRFREILGRDDRIVVVEDAELQTAGTDIDREDVHWPSLSDRTTAK